MNSFLIIFFIVTLTNLMKSEINEISRQFQLIENVVRDPKYLVLDDYKKLVVLANLYDIISNSMEKSNSFQHTGENDSLRLKDGTKKPSTSSLNRIFIG